MADEATPIPNSTSTVPAPTEPAPALQPSDPPAAEPQPAPADAPPADAPAEDKPEERSEAEKAYLNGDDKPADGDQPAPEGPPETYELTPPEGFEHLDAASVAVATPVFQELGLSNEQAQKLMPVAAEFAQRITTQAAEKLQGDILSTKKQWFEAAKSDPEIGGANWDSTLQSAARGLDRLGYPKGSDFRQILEDSGLEFHPEMIRAWSKVGKAISEDTDFVRGGQDAPVKKTDAELFYGRKD